MFSFHGMDTSNEIQFTVFPNDLHKFIDVIEVILFINSVGNLYIKECPDGFDDE